VITASNPRAGSSRRRVVAGATAAVAGFVLMAMLHGWAGMPGGSTRPKGAPHVATRTTVRPAASAPQSPGPPPVSGRASGLDAPASVADTCAGEPQATPLPAATTLTQQWKLAAPRPDVSYHLDKVTSLAYPYLLSANGSVFAIGTTSPAVGDCVIGGYAQGQLADAVTWEQAHAHYNGACLRYIGEGSIDIHNLRCDNVEDGVRPEETARNANDATLNISGTYFTRVHDDCIENDFVIGGILADSLWEQCNTGVSERPPSKAADFSSPKGESLTLDHMLLGLYVNPHRAGPGENALFKWSSSGNALVIRCSLFKVDALSLNGAEAMSFPAKTTIDDRACPADPTTLVWLGGGSYPGQLPVGVKVVSTASTWARAVTAWRCRHGYQTSGC
jgi:hypothetical protein